MTAGDGTAAGWRSLSRERFLTRLGEFEAGYVVGHLAGVGVWFQLLTAMVFTHEGAGEERLLLGEAFFTPGTVPGDQQLSPRNACIIPWDRVQALKDDGRELMIELADGRLRIVPAGAEPRVDWLGP